MLEEKKARCASCGNTFDIDKELEIRIRRKYKIFQPEGVTMLRTKELLELRYSMTPSGGCSFRVVLIAVSVFVLVFLGVVYSSLNSFSYVLVRDTNLLLFLGGTVLMIGFSILAGFRRIKTLANVDLKAFKDRLEITQVNKEKGAKDEEPPVREKRELSSSGISQFYVTRKVMSGFTFYSVFAKSLEKDEIEILPMVPELQTALFIEQELEDFYELKDQKMEGEVE